MTRLFFKLWAAMVAIALLALAVDAALWIFGNVEEDRQLIVDLTRGGITQALDQVRQTPSSERPTLLADLSRTFGHPITQIDADEVPADLRDLTTTEAWFSDDFEAFVFVAIEPGGPWLRFGPIGDYDFNGLWLFIVQVMLTALVVALLLGLLLRPTAQRLRALEDAARDMAQGNLDVRVDPDRGGATEPLAIAFNRMIARVKGSLEARRRLLHAVSHELRTPLTRIKLGLHLLDLDDPESFLDQRSVIELDLDEVEGLVTEILDTARYDDAPAQRTPLKVRATLETTIAQRTPSSTLPIILADDTFDGLWSLDPLLFARAIGNLIDNARRYARTSIQVSATVSHGQLKVTVDDDGPGIPTSERERVFEAFARLDDDKQGYGLGLAIVRAIVERHGGSATIEDAPSGGCRATTTWPAPDKAPLTAPQSQ